MHCGKTNPSGLDSSPDGVERFPLQSEAVRLVISFLGSVHAGICGLCDSCCHGIKCFFECYYFFQVVYTIVGGCGQ